MKDLSQYLQAESRLWTSTGLEPTEHRVHLDHSDVTVRIQEVGEGPPILFIHGASNSGASWAGLVARLEGFRCLMLDRPGAGLSDPLKTPFADVESLAKFSDSLVIDVLDAMNIDSADLVATSYGGYSALRAAAAHPTRIRHAVILGWTMGASNASLPAFMRVAGTPLGRLLTKLPVNERAVRSMFKRIGLRQALEADRIPQEAIDCYVALLRHTDTMLNELEIGRWVMNWRGLNDDIALTDGLLSKISTPVYFLWGEEDPFGPPEVARDFAERITGAELELMAGAGHAVWLDDPDHSAKVIATFLRSPVTRLGSP